MTNLSTQNKNDYTIFLPDNIPLEMVKVEGGPFMMGGEEKDSEKPIHEVNVSDFHIGKYPVTVRQYLAFVKETDSHHPEWMEEGSLYNAKTGNDVYYKQIGKALTHLDHPVVGITWEDAVAFCKWLSNEDGNVDSRLPSEAEWEYTARGGRHTKELIYAGSNKLKEVAWYDKNSYGQTWKVGLKLPNELGIYDMSGNVWEWCADYWYKNYKSASNDGSVREENSDENERVIRGGSWGNYDISCRSTYRNRLNANFRDFNIGFRIVQRSYK